MKLTLNPHPLGGSVCAIASKSQAHRLLICAAFAGSPTKIVCSELSQDIEASARCLSALGAELCYADGFFSVRPIELPHGDVTLDCGESGATLRFLLPVVAALGVSATFVLHGRLAERPLDALWEELSAHGCRLSRPTADTIHCEGRLRGGTFRLPGNISSQFISGLLFALPLTGMHSDIMLTSALESRSYINMTRDALHWFGIDTTETETGWQISAGQSYLSPGTTIVEGDWSNAAFWLCAGSVSSRTACIGLSAASKQGDKAIVRILEAFGAHVTWENDAVTVSPAPLHAITFDASDIPDLVPPIALVATQAAGTTRITGVERLRMKESDRLQSVSDTLCTLGAAVEIEHDTLVIHRSKLHGGTVHSFQDHRIAMLAAIASSVCTQPVHLCGAEAVKKSYPRFWEDFRALGGKKEEKFEASSNSI